MDNDDNVIDITPARLNRMRNLKPYKGKSDDEIIALIATKSRRQPKAGKPRQDYDKLFKEKRDILQKEFAVDMNNSNDAETLNNLVRLQIQFEQINSEIDALQSQPSRGTDDYKNLKTLGDFQRNVSLSIKELQTELGISRKQRKEKAVDDIPKWTADILARADKFFETKTTTIYCPKCKIELFRFWMNFEGKKGSINNKPLNNEIQLNLQCWKCEEQVEHIQ